MTCHSKRLTFPPAERDHHSVCVSRTDGRTAVPRPARGGRSFPPSVPPSFRPPPASGGGRFASVGCGGWPSCGRAPRGRFGVRPSVRPYGCRGVACAVRFTSVTPVYICKPRAVYICKPPLSIAGVNPLAAAVATAVLARANRLASRSVCTRSRSLPPAWPRAPTRPARPWHLLVRLSVALAVADPRGWPTAFESLVCENEYCPPPSPSTRLSHPWCLHSTPTLLSLFFLQYRKSLYLCSRILTSKYHKKWQKFMDFLAL